jgi:glycosyltransferase involved in cell wall biosynthesis
MRICLVSEEFPPETGWGGIGTHTYNLSLALADLGHDVEVVSKSVDGNVHVLEKGNLRIYRIPESDNNHAVLRSLGNVSPKIQKYSWFSSFSEYPLKTLRRGAAISHWLKSKPPFDIIETPDYGGETFWCQFINKIKIPVVVKLHTPLYLTQRLNSAPKDDMAVKLRKWMEKYCITHATKIISPTKSLADLICKEFGVGGINILPNCIDTDFFNYREKDHARKEKIIMYAGRLERRKGVEVLAKAIPLVLRSFPYVKFQFVGRDTPTGEGRTSMKAWLEDYFHQEKVMDHVDFVGEVPRTGIVSYFQQADACVLPSLWENLPYTCLEAMSCGTPVVGSNVGGFPEIITPGVNGLLFEPQNHEDLAAKITQMITSEDIRAFGIKARDRIVSTYGHKVIAEKTIELYQHVIRG